MTYACPAWEFAAETYLLKLQRLQNKVLRIIGSFARSTSVRNMHMAFQIPYKIMQAASKSHTKSWKRKCSLYWTSPTQEIQKA
jgi:hypothetical protein